MILGVGVAGGASTGPKLAAMAIIAALIAAITCGGTHRPNHGGPAPLPSSAAPAT